jgi:predicted O-linked N-acetylglucosamine transferase (SPINDLY family)
MTGDPTEDVAALYSLAARTYQSGRYAEALRQIEPAVGFGATSADCHNLHGLVLLALGRAVAASAAFDAALAVEPEFADARNNFGAACEALGQTEDAEAAYRDALEWCPDYAEAACNLGRMLLRLGRPDESATASRRALKIRPDLGDARINLAVAQQRQGQDGAAEETILSALASEGDNAILHRFLGVLHRRQGDLCGAQAALRQALVLDPSLAQAHDGLAAVLLDQGNLDAAEASFRRALELCPGDAHIHSNLLLCLNYRETDPKALLAAHRTWAERHATKTPLLPAARPKPSPRRLRLGYLSGDFRRHSVAYFLEPLLAQHDRSRFEIFCYATNENPDVVTDRLRASAGHWRWVSGLDDAQLAHLIRADEIDILIELSGHTAGNRLGALAYRPAPVQVSWCGYPNTTGMTALDYRIVDAITDPPGAQTWASETLVALPGGYLCYRPPGDAPALAPLPAQTNGYVTFGSFNNLRKVTPAVVALWAALLHRVPHTRLLLKARSLADQNTAQRLYAMFAGHGIDADRVTLRGSVAGLAAHLGAYAALDIALDPFPYNGTTTTCEALWMGVPVITLAGNRHAGRVGASLLTRISFADCIAANEAEYLDIAGSLAADIPALAKRRAGLRRRMTASRLCDAPAFTADMEAAFEKMFRCAVSSDA